MNSPQYYIQIRFHGKAKYKLRKLISEVNHRFGLDAKRAVPHITLAGPFTTEGEGRLIEDFHTLCSNTPLMAFEVNGFGVFEDKKVIYLDVRPDNEMKKFRWTLAQKLQPYCQLSMFDNARKFAFHATIKQNLPDSIFDAVKAYICNQFMIKFKYSAIRITLLRQGIILREYDFLQKKLLNRQLALDENMLSRTLVCLSSGKRLNYNL